MPFNKTTRESLKRDSRVVGKEWNKVYGGYFSDTRVLDSFVRAGEKHWAGLPKKPRILYLCSGNGLLGEHLAEHLREKGLEPTLTIVDASPEHLEQNANPKTRKLQLDVLDMDLKEEFDVIIARSSQDYQPTPELQVKMLETVARHLKPNGIFINQAASFDTEEARDLADRIYKTTPAIGDRHFQWHGDIGSLYEKAGLMKPEKIGDAPVLALTHEDHSTRYGIIREDVTRIRGLIRAVPASKRKEIKVTGKGYKMNCLFPIYASKLKR